MRSPEDTVRAFYECYSDGRPQDFDTVVASDYCDFGHEPAGRGPEGARADYEQAVAHAGGVIRYAIDALVVDGDAVAANWAGNLPTGQAIRGLSLYRVADGLLRSTRHTRL